MMKTGRIVNLDVGRSRFSGASHEYHVASIRSKSADSDKAIHDASG